MPILSAKAPSPTLTRAQSLFFRFADLVVSGSGLAYAYFVFVAAPSADDFSVVASPLQPVMQHLHVLAAPLLVFAVGWLWSQHAMKRFGHARAGLKPGKFSGYALLFLFFPMAMTGYLLQVSVDETLRRTMSLAHTALSLAWVASSAVHALRLYIAPSPKAVDPEAIEGIPLE
jgi:hypothetical protein